MNLLLLLLSFIFTCCDDHKINQPGDTGSQISITEGAWGNVWFWEGNFMPVEPTGTITPVERDILIYEATPQDSVDYIIGGMYRSVRTKLIATTHSNQTGFFQITLQPGMYSAFVKEDSLLWSGTSNNIGIGGFQVLSNSVTKIQIDINYRAAY